MAFAATTVWESNAAATGGDTSNGGGFDPGNASMATDLAATSATGTAPVVTSASYNFITRDNGHYLFIKSGTNWIPGEYPITSTSGNAATLNAAVGAVRLFTNGAFSGLNTVAGCATTASPTGGTWSIDYSQSTTAAVTFTDLVINGATNTSFTSAANPIGKNFVGSIVSITSGTGFTVQRIQISSVSGTTGTADKSLGTLSSTGGNGGLGGALASPGKAAGLFNGSGTFGGSMFVKAATYALSTSSNASGGEMSLSDVTCVGYNTTRTTTNTDATRPLLQATANSRTLAQSNGNGIWINLDFDANGKTGCTALAPGSFGSIAYRCKATGGFATGFKPSINSNVFVDCYASGSTTGFDLSGNNGCSAHGCVAIGGTLGFNIAGTGCQAHFCIASGCSTSGFQTGSGGSANVFENCSTYNCATASGSHYTLGNARSVLRNCVGYTAAGGGTSIFDGGTSAGSLFINCAGGGAAGSTTTGSGAYINLLALTANPYTSVSTDFSLNNTAGGGALLRGAGAPATFFGLATTASAPDIGAVQHAAAAGGPVAGNLRGGYVNG